MTNVTQAMADFQGIEATLVSDATVLDAKKQTEADIAGQLAKASQDTTAAQGTIDSDKQKAKALGLALVAAVNEFIDGLGLPPEPTPTPDPSQTPAPIV